MCYSIGTMLANTGWPAFFFAQGIARTSYLVLGSMLIETVAIWYVLRRNAAKAPPDSSKNLKTGWWAAFMTAFLANAASLLYGLVIIQFTDIGSSATDMGAINMTAAFWVYWLPGVIIEIAVVEWHRRILSAITTLVIALSNLATWCLMQVVPQIPMIDWHPPG
jgi:hypothetical protein